MDEKVSYVENLTFYSPHFQDGVHDLGDLWNCRSSKAIGHNIFKTNVIGANNLRTTLLDNLDHTLTHVKSELETAKSLNIEGHLSLELLLGIIKLEGNVKFQKEKSDKTHTEVISCRYIHENCCIVVSPPVEPLINEHVLEMITSGNIEATHVVGGMIVGCSVTALIELKNKEYSKDSEVSGQLGLDKGGSNKTGENNQKSKWSWLNKVVGNFSGEVKAEWEKKEKSNQLDIQIKCNARPMPPGLSPPSSVEQLFELIEKMPSALSGATDFSDLTGHSGVRGVPIQFILYPIAQFAKIDIIKLYKKLEDDLLDKFQEMLSKAIQIQHHDYIKQLMLIRDKKLSFLLNRKSILSDKVKELESNLKDIGKKFVAIGREQLERYKNGKCEPGEFGSTLEKFDASIVSSIEKNIQELADEGALEIFEAQGTDESNIKRFTDNRDRQKWIHEESGSKIIFEIGPQCPRMTISGYHQIVTPLSKIGIKTALMMPSIAKEVKLSLMFEDHEIVFKESEVQQAIEILCANFRIGNQTRAEFFAVIAATEGIEFPVLKSSSELGNTLQTMIDLVKDYSHFEFVDSINDFQRSIKSLKSDHVAFCLPIDAPETALDFFQHWKDYHIKNVTWIIHSFGFENEQEIPLLFVLSKTDVLGICFDRLDLLILEKRIKEAGEPFDINFDLFSVDQMHTSFNMLRTSSAFRILSRIAPNSIKTIKYIAYPSKPETNSEVTEFLSFVRKCLKLNELIILSAVAQMALNDFPTLTSMLEKCGWKCASNEFSEEVLDRESCKGVVAEIENWLEDDTLIREIDKAEELLSDSSCLSKKKCIDACGIVANHSHCPVGYRSQLQQCQQIRVTESVEKVIDILKKLRISLCNKVAKSHFSFLHVRMLLRALNLVSYEKQSVEALIKRLIEEYYKNINWDFSDGWMDKYIQNNQIYLLLQQISPYKYDKWRCTLQKGLNTLRHLDDYEALAQLIQDLSEVSTAVDNIAQIWKNAKWLHLVRNCISVKQTPKEKLLRVIGKWIENTEGKIIMPDDIQQKLNSLEIVEFENIVTVKDVERILEKVVATDDDTPWYFKEHLATAMKKNPSLESDLVQVGAAIHWDAELKLFTKEWNQKDVKLALQNIQESSQSKILISPTNIKLDFKLDLVTPLKSNEQDESSRTTRRHREQICYKFFPIMGNEFTRLSDKDYLMVRPVIEYKCKPRDVQLPSLLPFLLQQIKFWDGNVLRASRISKLSSVHDENEEMFSNDPFAMEATSTDNTVAGSEPNQPLSRLDCIAYVINTVECTVAQEILRILSKFPLALSLIIPDIRDENKFIVTFPLLKDIVIRWEASKRVPELSQLTKTVGPVKAMIVENHLFSSPFRLIVAVRIGTHHTGKSQILNQVMSYPYYFSSRAEAGNSIGPPCTLNGTVEFTWLTEETCSDEIWTGLLEDHYAHGRDEIVLLANLHGSVLDFPAIVKYLNKLASCFIVFLMPNSNSEDWKKLKTQISGNLLNIMVDRGNPKISTSNLIHKDTQLQIIKLLRSALSQKSSNNQDRVIVDVEEPLTYSEEIRTTQSEDVTALISNYSCSDIKKSMTEFLQDGYNKWNNDILKHLTKSILQILNSSKRLDVKRAMIHLETELSKKSAKESVEPRGHVLEAQRQLQLAKFQIKDKSEDQSFSDNKTEMLNKQLVNESVRVNDANLGLEHFFRVFGEIYRISQGQYNSDANEIKKFPQYYADLLLNGHSLEILNGDNGEIPLDWLRAIFQHVHKRKPNLRVFVISIIGIQSSGKSTLLNALFSCRFAVSVGRCSRGLYMRMIFLDENLRRKGGYDAIILIDTEGLASSEKMNERDAERKDRLLATFAMGLSNLTIINVLGEELTSMTEILQIVIVTMARLRQADVKPDMIVVQHLQERNSLKLNEAKCQFINAIKTAFDLVNKCDVDIGATQNACLAELISGIERQDMFFQFSSFKNGSSVHAPPSESYHKDVVHLYQNLLARAEAAPRKLSFERWFQLVENYWNSVTNEKFALNFKNAKKISDFLHYGQKVATIKELIGKAFGFHREELSKRVRERVSQYLSQKKESQLEQLRQELTNEALSELNNVPYYCSSETCGHCKQISQQIEGLLQEVNETEWHKDIGESITKCIESKTNNELKIFNQQFDVLVLHNNVSTEAVRLINTAIKDEFKGRSRETPGGNKEFKNYSETEKTKIINKIWDKVQKIAQSKVTGAPLMEEIEKAFDNEYRGSYPNIYKHVKNNLAKDMLKSETAKISFFSSSKLSKNELWKLISTVEKFVKGIFSSSGYDLQVSTVGMKFEAVMIMKIKHNISEMIKGFEKKNKVELISEFKQWIVLYTYEMFIKYMQPVHEKWENQNMPTKILLGKENFYKAEIKTRLEHGFSCASDGFVKAGYIIETVKQKALDSGYKVKIQSILDHVWLTNTMKVRLQYFEELALEVKVRKFCNAFAHFNDPKKSIERWFKKKIESIYSKNKVAKRSEEIMKKEIAYILDEVQKSGDFKNLEELLIQYQVPKIQDDTVKETGPNEHDFVTFRDSIKCKIEEFSQHYKDYFKDNHPSASEDTDVMDRLGCTEACPWCGALCWGSRGHHEDQGEINKHHTCHQPNGLIRTLRLYDGSLFLDPRVCQDIPDSELVLDDAQRSSGVSWGTVKMEYFGSWKFDSHEIKKLDEMMRWFFQELQKDIAKDAKCNPVPEHWLKRFKCDGLLLEDILATVRCIKD